MNLSIVIPVYNSENILEELVTRIYQSLKKKNFQGKFEIILINDCSKDNTKKIIKSFNDDRIRLVSNNLNIGQTKSLNKGLKEAKGADIARMDSDDISFPNWLEKSIDFLGNNI